jgi:hypothetical protein
MQEYPRPPGYAAYKPGHAGTAKAREIYYRACIAKALAQGTLSQGAVAGTASSAVPSNDGKDHPHQQPQ